LPFLARDSIAGLKVTSNFPALVHRRYLMPAASIKKVHLAKWKLLLHI